MFKYKLVKLSHALYHSGILKSSQQIFKLANDVEPLSLPQKEKLTFEDQWLKTLEERINKKDSGGSDLNQEQKIAIFYIRHKDKQAQCAYCGDYLDPNSSNIFLDRVDNNKMYSLGNVVFCCQVCNQIKGNSKIENLLDFSANVVRHLNFYNGVEGAAKIQNEANKLKDIVENYSARTGVDLSPTRSRATTKGLGGFRWKNDIIPLIVKIVDDLLKDQNFIEKMKRETEGKGGWSDGRFILNEARKKLALHPKIVSRQVDTSLGNIMYQIKGAKENIENTQEYKDNSPIEGIPYNTKDFFDFILGDTNELTRGFYYDIEESKEKQSLRKERARQKSKETESEEPDLP